MDNITLNDLELINKLCGRTYTGNRLLSNASGAEHGQLTDIKRKLRAIAEFFAKRYGDEFGPFTTGISSGNPIALGGTRFNNVWSGLFKGAENKQYSAQISFVMNRQEKCLNVGFYFGAASAHNLTADERHRLESQLSDLGNNLSYSLVNNPQIRSDYERLFDNGFLAIGSGKRMLPDNWVQRISENTANSQLITKIYPNELGYIENSTIDSFVAQVMFLMKSVEPDQKANQVDLRKPLTPEQRAKQAERRAIIGHMGEVYVMESEKQKLIELGLATDGYPKHVALESMSYGYDILSKDKNAEDILIEVKTTTRTQEDLGSRKFFISVNEVNTYNRYPETYKIYRVYDIDNEPSIEIIDFEADQLSPDGYILEY